MTEALFECQVTRRPRASGFGRSATLWTAIGAFGLGLGGCGGSYSSTGAYEELYPGEVQNGTFKPGSVAGLSFRSGAQSGVTGVGGDFSCETTQQVSFSLGAVNLGSALCASVVHPASFATSGSLMDAGAINKTRFLMLLDADQDFDNGIVVPQALRDLAGTWPPIDFTAADFESQLTRVTADIASVESRPTVIVPSSADAHALLDSSLSCAYAGLFVNTFAAGPFLAPTDVALTVSRPAGTSIDRFAVNISRKHPQSFMYLIAEGTVELNAFPTLVNDSPAGAGMIDGRYLTPDILSANWDNAIAQQPIDRFGSFQALRVGDDDGDYRFVGRIMAPLDSSVPILVGAVTMILEGDTVTGTMFDLALGATIAVSGTRLPNSDAIDFSTEISVSTALATLVADQNGEPVGLQGAWPDIENSTLSMDGCRMN